AGVSGSHEIEHGHQRPAAGLLVPNGGRSVTELLDDAEDEFARAGRDVASAVEDFGDGRLRDPGSPGDVGQGDSPGRGLAVHRDSSQVFENISIITRGESAVEALDKSES